MANVTDYKTAKSFKSAWDKSTAQPAVQAGSKLEVGEHSVLFKGFRLIEYERDNQTKKIALVVFTSNKIEDTGIISDADAMKIKPTTKLTCLTTKHKESGTNRNKVVLK